MKLALSITFCFSFYFVLTQKEITINKNCFYPELNLKGAFIVPHANAVKSLVNGTFPIYEIGAEFPNIGNNHFQNNFPYHKWGLMLNFSPLSKKEVLGFGIGVLPYLNINLNKRKESRWKFRLASGIGFIEKPFNNITNPKNMVIGSYLNNITDFTLYYKIDLPIGLVSKIGLGMQHFSNGAFTRPNHGLNMPYLSLSIKSENKKQKKGTEEIKITNEKNSSFVGFHYGTKTLTFASENRYHVFQFSGGYSFGFKRGDFIHIQSDIIIDQSIPFLKEYDFNLKKSDKILAGILSKYEKKFGQIGVFFGLGIYLHSPFKKFTQDWTYVNNGSFFYNRIGIKYYFLKNIFTQISVRSHMQGADNTEFGLVYQFK